MLELANHSTGWRMKLWVASLVLAVPCPALAADPVLDWPQRVIELDYRPQAPPAYEPPVITSVSLQPGGNLLAAVGDDHSVRLWDRDTGKLVRTLAGHTDWVRCVQFTPDGKSLVSAGNDRRILVWNLADGKSSPRELATHPEAIAVLALSHNGTMLAAAGFENKVHVYDMTGGKHLLVLTAPCSDMRALAFSPNDRVLAGGGRCGHVRLWDTASGDERTTFAAHHQRIRGLCFSADMEQLVTVSEDRFVRVWQVRSGEMMAEFNSSPAKVQSVTFLGPTRIASAGSDNLVRIWDIRTKQVVGVLRGHTGSVVALGSRDGQLVPQVMTQRFVYGRSATTPPFVGRSRTIQTVRQFGSTEVRGFRLAV